jgi:hypothetical protein
METQSEQNLETKIVQPKKKIFLIILISGIIVIVVVAVVLGVILGTKKKENNNNNNYSKVNIVNSYDNTDELIQKFPVGNPTTVKPGLESKIQNRLLTGFENWNRGFEAWKAWGNILYTSDSIYNVHGARLTLAQYQQSMDITLKKTKILMGDFHNMLICDEFTAIYYDITTIVGERQVPGTVMEFVKFKDYGDPLGTRVVEGWGGTNDTSYNGMTNFQGPEEKSFQDAQINYMLNYQIPSTSDLKEKYIIKYPTIYIDDNAEQLLNIILEGFDSWNNGINSLLTWIDSNYDTNALSYSLKKVSRSISEYKNEMEELFQKYNIKKIYFDNVLIRDNWAGLHYRFTNKTLETNEITVGDRMEFLKFELIGSVWKIVASWIK